MTFGVVLIFFFSVYLRGNIDDFVVNQVMSLLHRSQESLVKTLTEDSGFSDLAYDADVMHLSILKINVSNITVADWQIILLAKLMRLLLKIKQDGRKAVSR